jgi:hypothetical protein
LPVTYWTLRKKVECHEEGMMRPDELKMTITDAGEVRVEREMISEASQPRAEAHRHPPTHKALV